MKQNEKETTQVETTYEPPRLDTISLHSDEVLAGSCKDLTGAGPNLNCEGAFGITCATLGS